MWFKFFPKRTYESSCQICSWERKANQMYINTSESDWNIEVSVWKRLSEPNVFKKGKIEDFVNTNYVFLEGGVDLVKSSKRPVKIYFGFCKGIVQLLSAILAMEFTFFSFYVNLPWGGKQQGKWRQTVAVIINQFMEFQSFGPKLNSSKPGE